MTAIVRLGTRYLLTVAVLLASMLTSCTRGSQGSPVEDQKSSPQHHQLLLITVGDKEGYVDETGKIVINPQFDQAYHFQEGRALVCVGECDKEHLSGYRMGKDYSMEYLDQTYKMGYIDESGKLVVNPQYEWGSDFSEGLAAVCVGKGCYPGVPKDKTEQADEKWGYISNAGTLVIPAQFESANKFSEGLAAVSVGGKWGYIDKTGKFMINPVYDMAGEFEHGIAMVGFHGASNILDYKDGYIDKSGKYIWQPSN